MQQNRVEKFYTVKSSFSVIQLGNVILATFYTTSSCIGCDIYQVCNKAWTYISPGALTKF